MTTSTITPTPFASHAAQLAARQVTLALDRMMLALAEGQADVTAYLKLAGRNAGILARHALQVPEDRPATEAILDHVIEAAELADDQAIQQRPTMLGYLLIITTCIDWLAKLEAASRREQQRAIRDTQRISRHFPSTMPTDDALPDEGNAPHLMPWSGVGVHVTASGYSSGNARPGG